MIPKSKPKTKLDKRAAALRENLRKRKAQKTDQAKTKKEDQ